MFIPALRMAAMVGLSFIFVSPLTEAKAALPTRAQKILDFHSRAEYGQICWHWPNADNSMLTESRIYGRMTSPSGEHRNRLCRHDAMANVSFGDFTNGFIHFKERNHFGKCRRVLPLRKVPPLQFLNSSFAREQFVTLTTMVPPFPRPPLARGHVGFDSFFIKKTGNRRLHVNSVSHLIT